MPADDARRTLPPVDAATLFETARGLVYRWSLAHGLRHEQALDVVQETFTRLLGARPVFGTEAAQIAWLRRTASNLAVDHWRKSTPLPLVDHASSGRADLVELEESRRRLGDALRTMPENQRLALLAKIVEGRTFSRVASDLGVSVPTAKTHVARALARVRDAFERHSGAPA